VWTAFCRPVRSRALCSPPVGPYGGPAPLRTLRAGLISNTRDFKGESDILSSVRYGGGRGGFSLARPRPYTGPGGYVSGNPRPAPVPGQPALIPWTGPRLLPPIFNGDLSGVWVGRGPERGQGQGMPKKAPRPRPLSGAGRGKGPGPAFFRAPSAP